MNDNRLLRVQRIFREIFDDHGLKVTPTLSPAEVPEWDSVATVQIVLALEQEFSFRFATDAVARIQSVQDLLDALPR